MVGSDARNSGEDDEKKKGYKVWIQALEKTMACGASKGSRMLD